MAVGRIDTERGEQTRAQRAAIRIRDARGGRKFAVDVAPPRVIGMAGLAQTTASGRSAHTHAWRCFLIGSFTLAGERTCLLATHIGGVRPKSGRRLPDNRGCDQMPTVVAEDRLIGVASGQDRCW